jgi:AcrR family transcriptional regulator
MPDKTATLREKLRQTAAQTLLDSAEREMVKKGYDRATMQEIAAAAGCATGTFYLYFKNKEELFQAIIARHAQALFAAARAAMDQTDDPVEKLRLSTNAHVLYIHEHQDFFKLFMKAVPMRHRSLHQRLSGDTRQEHDSYNRIELEIIRKGQKQGKLRSDVPAELIQEFMLSAGFGIVEHFLFSSDPPPVRQQVRALWELIAGGMGVNND